MLDEDSSGKLSYDELKSVVMMFNLKIPAKIVQKIIELADWDGSGDIDYAEFARIISADDILQLKDTLTGDVINAGERAGTVKIKGLKAKKANREGPATMREGVTEKDLRYAQTQLRQEIEEKYSKITDAFKFIDADRTGKCERDEIKQRSGPRAAASLPALACPRLRPASGCGARRAPAHPSSERHPKA